DYINTRKFNREVISAALGVPAPLIGDADNSTYNNLDTLKTDFWQDTITNYLEEIRQDLTNQILIPYYGDGRRTRAPAMRYMYDLSNVEALQVNLEMKAKIAKTLRETGFSLSDINQKLEFGFKVTPEMEAGPQPEPEPEQDEQPDREAVTRMVEVAVTVASDERLFEKAIVQIHQRVSENVGLTSYPEAAAARASEYLAQGVDVVAITDREVAVCRR
ncbi:MAG: phage portal protein, partial [Actinobacteria bacterium]|nr:phage portal protein [Actinomycetota bacterium]